MTDTPISEGQPNSLVDKLATFLSNAIDRTDEAAALERVSAVQEAQPQAGADELVTTLIKKKCLLTGGVGALTPVVALIGLPINLALVFKWQAELVLEIAAVHNRTLSAEEKRNIVLIVTGLSVGATQGGRLISRALEWAATRLVTGSKTSKAIIVPVVGSVVSAGTNVAMTYLIGSRAQAYFQSGSESLTSGPGE